MKRHHINTLIDIEIQHATKLHGTMPTSHHAYAVIKEELEEYWDCVKRDGGGSDQAVKELVQIAAMAIRAMMDTIGGYHA